MPLIVRVPGMKAAGEPSTSLVELVDLYPTLAELAGLPITHQLEGKSFVSTLNDPALVTKMAALSQYPRAGGLMGYSMRTPTHRLTQWVHPLLKLKIETAGSLNPISLTELQGKLEGTAHIESLHLSRSERGKSSPLAIPTDSSLASWKLAPLKLTD